MKKQSTPKSTGKSAIEIIPELVGILTKMPPEEREKAISAARILLAGSNNGDQDKPTEDRAGSGAADGLSARARAWLKQHSLTFEHLDQIFALDGTFDVIAARMPGRSKRQQTIEAYTVCGLRAFLQSGEPTFTDRDGRQLCQRVGCYDSANHYNYMKGFDNRITGSKESGWRLTNPGLTAAAHIVAELAEGAH